MSPLYRVGPMGSRLRGNDDSPAGTVAEAGRLATLFTAGPGLRFGWVSVVNLGSRLRGGGKKLISGHFLSIPPVGVLRLAQDDSFDGLRMILLTGSG